MDPVAGEGLARVGFGLGDLVLVVREDKVVAAAVDVDLFAEFGKIHSGAFDVPAGATLAPRAVPGNFARLGGFPEGEVHRVVLGFFHLDACACLHIVKFATGEFAVVVVADDAEVDVAVRRGIRGFLLDQPLNEVDDKRHGLAYLRSRRGRLDIEVGKFIGVCFDIAL